MWKKFWLLFTVIWIVVSALNVATILAFSEEHQKAWRPFLLMIAVPAVLYALGCGWAWLKRKRGSSGR
jgi:hypothetical protein